MGMTIEQELVLKEVRKRMFEAEDMDTINKLYRQARTWARFESYYKPVPNEKRYREIVEVLKQHKRWAKKALWNREQCR